MVNTEIRMIIFFAAKDGEAVYSRQKQDQSWLWFRSWAPYCQIGYLELPKLVYLFTASVLSFSAGVQLQQPGIQPERVSSVGEKLRQPLIFLGLPVYFKLMILFYTFTKALGQRFDIFSSHWPRFISLQKSLLPLKRSSFLSDSLIYFFSCVLVNTL